MAVEYGNARVGFGNALVYWGSFNTFQAMDHVSRFLPFHIHRYHFGDTYARSVPMTEVGLEFPH